LSSDPFFEEISETLYSIQFENQNFSCKQKYFSKYGLQLDSLLLYYSISLLNPAEACVYKKYIPIYVLLKASNGKSAVAVPLPLLILSTHYTKTALQIPCQTKF